MNKKNGEESVIYDKLTMILHRNLDHSWDVSRLNRLQIMNLSLNTAQILRFSEHEMYSIIGSFLGGSSFSAVLLGAANVPVDGSSASIFLTACGGALITLSAMLIENRLNKNKN